MKAFFVEKAALGKSKMAAYRAQKENGENKEMTAQERYTKANECLDSKLVQKEKLTAILSNVQMEKFQRMKKPW